MVTKANSYIRRIAGANAKCESLPIDRLLNGTRR